MAGFGEEIAGGWMAFGGRDSWANQAGGLGLDGPVSAADVDRLVEFYVSRGATPKIHVCPFVHRSLLSGLGERGFVVDEFGNVLARELAPDEDLRALLPHGWPDATEIVEVDPDDADGVGLFAELSTSGFRSPDEPMSEAALEHARSIVKHPRCIAYLALVNGTPAAGATVECEPPVATLFATSVLPRFRRRGIQTALIAHRLEEARRLDCDLAVIQSIAGVSTERNAVRLGFSLAYSKIIMMMTPGR